MDCKLTKAKHKPCAEAHHRTDVPFQRLHSDLMGPLKPVAYRSRYIFTFTDDATSYAFAYEIADEKRVNLALLSYLESIRKLAGICTSVAEICTDGGLEYRTQETQFLCYIAKILL